MKFRCCFLGVLSSPKAEEKEDGHLTVADDQERSELVTAVAHSLRRFSMQPLTLVYLEILQEKLRWSSPSRPRGNFLPSRLQTNANCGYLRPENARRGKVPEALHRFPPHDLRYL